MSLAIAIAKVGLATLLQLRFWFLLCSSSLGKMLLTHFTSHGSGLLSTHTQVWSFSKTPVACVLCCTDTLSHSQTSWWWSGNWTMHICSSSWSFR